MLPGPGWRRTVKVTIFNEKFGYAELSNLIPGLKKFTVRVI